MTTNRNFNLISTINSNFAAHSGCRAVGHRDLISLYQNWKYVIFIVIDIYPSAWIVLGEIHALVRGQDTSNNHQLFNTINKA